MYKLDSDLMGIIFALLTFLVPVISAISERKRKKRKEASKPQNGELFQGDAFAHEDECLHDEEDVHEEDDSLKSDIDEIFDMILGNRRGDDVKGDEADTTKEEVAEELPAEEALPQTFIQPEAPEVYEESVVEEPDTKPAEGIKGRLSKNPKDMVIFAEIMNPKYKEL